MKEGEVTIIDSQEPYNHSREPRVNGRILAREVRLINESGEIIGIVLLTQALDLARKRNLDVVEISPQAIPPVCKLMDYDQFKKEQAIHEKGKG